MPNLFGAFLVEGQATTNCVGTWAVGEVQRSRDLFYNAFFYNGSARRARLAPRFINQNQFVLRN